MRPSIAAAAVGRRARLPRGSPGRRQRAFSAAFLLIHPNGKLSQPGKKARPPGAFFAVGLQWFAACGAVHKRSVSPVVRGFLGRQSGGPCVLMPCRLRRFGRIRCSGCSWRPDRGTRRFSRRRCGCRRYGGPFPGGRRPAAHNAFLSKKNGDRPLFPWLQGTWPCFILCGRLEKYSACAVALEKESKDIYSDDPPPCKGERIPPPEYGVSCRPMKKAGKRVDTTKKAMGLRRSGKSFFCAACVLRIGMGNISDVAAPIGFIVGASPEIAILAAFAYQATAT